MQKAKLIPIPQTESEFQTLVKLVCKKMRFSDEDMATAIIASRITHVPADTDQIAFDSLIRAIRRHIGHNVAKLESTRVNRKFYINELVSHLESNPDDSETRDKLELESKTSEYAREKFEELFPIVA